jgi:predicted ATPase
MADARILVLGTYRDTDLSPGHPLTHTLGELARHHHCQRIQLGRLGLGEVGQFIGGMAGFVPPAGLVEAVYARTAGNPLFMTQVVRWLLQQEAFSPGKTTGPTVWNIRIPTDVHDAIRARLDNLSGDCRQSLTIAAVVGREFELTLLDRLVDGMSKDGLLALLEEALAIRVIEELPGAPGRYQFAHILIRDTLLDELSSARQALMHGRFGQALEEIYGDNLGPHATDLAYHFGEAAPGIGPNQLVRYSLLAGEEALKVYAHEVALAHFRGVWRPEVSP